MGTFLLIISISCLIFLKTISDETAKWEKITYLGIATCTVLAFYNLSKGHPHYEEPPVRYLLFFLYSSRVFFCYVCFLWRHLPLALYWAAENFCLGFVWICSGTSICTFAIRSSHGVCFHTHVNWCLSSHVNFVMRFINVIVIRLISLSDGISAFFFLSTDIHYWLFVAVANMSSSCIDLVVYNCLVVLINYFSVHLFFCWLHFDLSAYWAESESSICKQIRRGNEFL